MQAVADHREIEGGIPRSEPLGAVAPAGLEGRFHAWRGRSGRRYVVSVYPAGAAPDYSEAVVIAVRRVGSLRVILAVGAVEPGGAPAAVLAAGADELHFHLMAPDAQARAAVAADLGEALATPARPSPRGRG